MVAALRRVLRALSLLLWIVLGVLAPGSDSFGYDAVGNQTTRPAGVTLTYTPFDLPKTINQGASAITFAYDGDEHRIRKTTPVEETLYFSDFSERITATGTATEHRYYVHSLDPSGFEYGPGEGPGPPDPTYVNNPEVQRLQALSCGGLECAARPPKQVANSPEAAQNGAATQPVDVGTTGSSSGYVPEPVTPAPQSWTHNPYVQVEGGFLGGVPLGVVPFAGVVQQGLDAGGVLPQGTPEARRGLAVGQIYGGIATFVGGLTGEVLGGFASSTGIGAAVGVPAIVVSTGLVLGGIANIGAGIRGLLTTGSGSGATGGEAWNPNGGVDFSKSSDLYPAAAGQKSIVKIQYTGSRRGDFKAANQAAGLGDGNAPPKGYTWHHLDDYDPATNTGTMQLVETPVHQANQPHIGGVKQYESATGRTYK